MSELFKKLLEKENSSFTQIVEEWDQLAKEADNPEDPDELIYKILKLMSEIEKWPGVVTGLQMGNKWQPELRFSKYRGVDNNYYKGGFTFTLMKDKTCKLERTGN
jgi:hypothetical protein